MKEDKILTLHPQGESGVMLPLETYEATKELIVNFFLRNPKGTMEEITKEIIDQINTDLEKKELIQAVSLDMEARDFIEQVRNSDPIQYQLKLFTC